jgi:uncharacterized protein (TIGR03435 family)
VRVVLALIAGASAIIVGSAQSPALARVRPQFEVASIKPCDASMVPQGRSGGGLTENSSQRLTVNCTTAKDLIQMAYVSFANGRYDQLSPVPIQGGPAWINSDRYQIEAKTESPESQITMRGIMLQSLLEDRFKLRIRRETRDVPVYVLIVAKGGPKMPRFQEGTCIYFDLAEFLSHFPPVRRPDPPPGQQYCPNFSPMTGPNVSWNWEGISVAELCNFVLRGMDRPVVDKTGLAGRFNIRLEYLVDETSSSAVRAGGSPDDGEHPAVPAGPSVFSALEQQLGLKLEPAKGPGQFLVIDSAERPSDN